MKASELHHAIDERFDRHLTRIQDFLRQPSIGATGEGMAEAAEQCKQAIEALGGSAELVPIGRHPIVFGNLDVGAERTILVWSKYDVMPADEPGWVVPPFSATVQEWQDLGPCLIARGAVDTKGPLQAFFNAVETLVELKQLPCNLTFVIEGEGEAGSGGMEEFINRYADQLKQSDAALVPFCTQERDDSAAPNLGVKGLVQVELTMEGGAWGGPAERDIHGGNASWIANPAWRLVHALASLVSRDEEILIDGYTQGARQPDNDDETLLAALDEDFNLEDQLRENGAQKFKVHGSPSQVVRRQLFDATCNISGLGSGYTDEGFKTLVPHRAIARMDLRLVPGMKPERVLNSMRKHLDDHGYQDVRIDCEHQYPASKVPLSNPFVQAAVKMYELHGVPTTIMPLKSGCAPLYLFTDVLGIPWVMAGLGHGGGQHSSNEYVTLRGLVDFEKSMVTLLNEMSR